MKRRTAVTVLVLAVVAAAAGGWIAGQNIRSPAEEAARTAPPEASPILVPAESRVLSTDIVTRGTGRFGSPQELWLPETGLKSAPRVATSLPSPGDVIEEGGLVLTVSNRPVFLLEGELPSFRDLGPGMQGEDVEQLEAALSRLGIDPGPEDGLFDVATATAVTSLYLRHGFQPLQVTEEQLAEIRPIEADSTPGSSAGPGVQVPADELLFLADAPVRVSDVAVDRGEQIEGPVVTVTSAQVAIDTSVSLDEAALIAPGTTAVIDEADLGIDTTGVVSFIADSPGTNEVGGSQIYVEVLVDDAPPSIIGASVRLTIAVESTGGPVLAVPVGALSLAADGSTRVQRRNGSVLEFVTVEPGLSADGMVEVTPIDGSLAAGDLVVVGFDQGNA